MMVYRCFNKFFLLFALICAFSMSFRAEAVELDKSKYITIDEIKPGMKAYALTVYKGTEIEKFELEVLSVSRGYGAGKNAIFVIGKDPRFIHSGAVAGCSGSPVVIDGRIAGALAFGWSYSKDPLYGVTPIDEMLRIDDKQVNPYPKEKNSAGIDYTKPLNLAEVNKSILNYASRRRDTGLSGERLLCPLVTNLPGSACEEMRSFFEPLGMMPVSSGGAIGNGKSFVEYEKFFEPGGIISIPLVTGDIEMSAVGTVTAVEGNKVYGFGHSFQGEGPMTLPISTGYVHLVMSSVERSFKLAQSGAVLGTLKYDEATGIYGEFGEIPHMIDLSVEVDRPGWGMEKQVYNCKIGEHNALTPLLVRSVLSNSTNLQGVLPLEHYIEYSISIKLDDGSSIEWDNFVSRTDIFPVVSEAGGLVGLLLNNPFKDVQINSIDYKIKIVPVEKYADLWLVECDDLSVKAGDTINIDVTLESVDSVKEKISIPYEMPSNLSPGEYNIMISGTNDYMSFVDNEASYKFVYDNYKSFFKALEEIVSYKNNRLWITLVKSQNGLMIQNEALMDLPGSKAISLQNSKRTIPVKPLLNWESKEIPLDKVVDGSVVLTITIEK